MKRLLVTAGALALALVSVLPGIAAARLAGNHNQTRLVAAIALALAIVSMLPGSAAAKLAGNHNQTRLRG